MNILKIQQDFLKGVLKERGKDHKDYHIGMSTIMKGVGFTDSHYMSIIPLNDNYIGFYDIPEFFPDNLIPKDLTGYQAAVPTEIIKVGKLSLYNIEVIGYIPKIHTYVNKKYMDYFSSKAIYYIKDRKSLIIVREDDAIVGAICPYIFKEA